ncbi:hypothetical protein IPF37_01955 [bacterium]|nr:MAG: hypothetical protein IPF37_01955 [bacterium]
MTTLCSMVRKVCVLLAVAVLTMHSVAFAAFNIPDNFASQADIDTLIKSYFTKIGAMAVVDQKIQALSLLLDRSGRATFNARTKTDFGNLLDATNKLATTEGTQLAMLPILSRAQASSLLSPVQQKYVAKTMVPRLLKSLVMAAAQKTTFQDSLQSLSALANPTNFSTKGGLRVVLNAGIRDMFYKSLVQLYDQRASQSDQAQAQLRELMRNVLQGNVPLLDKVRRQYVSQQLLPALDKFKDLKQANVLGVSPAVATVANASMVESADVTQQVLTDDRVTRLLASISKQPLLDDRLRFLSKLTAGASAGAFSTATQQAYADALVALATQSKDIAKKTLDLLNAARTSPLLTKDQQTYVSSTMIPEQIKPVVVVRDNQAGTPTKPGKRVGTKKQRKKAQQQKSGARKGAKIGKKMMKKNPKTNSVN